MIRFLDNGAIAFVGMPMPPSSNNCYPTGRNGMRFASPQLKAFKNAMELWGLTCAHDLRKASSLIREATTAPGTLLKIERQFNFQYPRIFTLLGMPKQLDVSNFVKGIDDALCNLLYIDDKTIWFGTEYKTVCKQGESEHVKVIASFIDVSHHIENKLIQSNSDRK